MRFDVLQEAKIKADLETINKRERNEINREKGDDVTFDNLDVRDDLDATANYAGQAHKQLDQSYPDVSASYDVNQRRTPIRRDPNAPYTPQHKTEYQ